MSFIVLFGNFYIKAYMAKVCVKIIESAFLFSLLFYLQGKRAIPGFDFCGQGANMYNEDEKVIKNGKHHNNSNGHVKKIK